MMKRRTTIMLSALLAVASLTTASATQIGFCDGTVGRDNIFRVGSTEQQGMAIRLDASKLAVLKGCDIEGVSIAFGSKRTTGDVKLFIATSLDSEPIVAKNVAIPEATKWCDFTFDAPYKITGNEDCVYVGYTASINTKSSLLMADFKVDSKGCSYFYKDGQWVDAYGMGYGNASVMVNVSGINNFTDMMIKPVNTSGYYKAGNTYVFGGQIFNFGTTTITSLDMSIAIGNSAPMIIHYNDLEIAPGKNFDFVLPEYKSDEIGHLLMTIDLVKINGGATDADLTDNKYSTDVYMYPADMERSILFEGFTGQACSNCPAGHATLASFMQKLDQPIVEVMHHAGYNPDYYTMDADLDYTFFYGGTQTFAPAIMLNRTTIGDLASTPTLMLSQSNLERAYEVVSQTQPYVSLGLETEFDAESREVTVKFSSYTHTDLPAEQVVFNVMLVQNKLMGYQNPVGNYEHNCVFRGVLTGNSWGILLPPAAMKSGGRVEWTHSFELPEAIFSDYHAGSTDQSIIDMATHPTVPENMYLVAFVGAYANDYNGHTVYNAVETPLGKSHVQGGMAGIESVVAEQDCQLEISVVGGRIAVTGDYDTLMVATIDGRIMSQSAALSPGIYVVRATKGTKATMKKVLVK